MSTDTTPYEHAFPVTPQVVLSRVEHPTDAVTRVEVIGSEGRLFAAQPVSDVSMAFQDDGRTLKVFLRTNPQVDDRPPSVNTRIEGKNVRQLINTSGAHELRAIAHALEDQRQAWRERALKAEEARSQPPQEESTAEGEEVCETCGKRIFQSLDSDEWVHYTEYHPARPADPFRARSESPRTDVCVSNNDRQPHQTAELVSLDFPFDEGRTIGIDHCIAPAIKALWDAGILTRGSCCGHGEVQPSVIIESEADAPSTRSIIREIDGREWAVLAWTLNPVPESPARETAHEKSVRDGAQRVAQRIADRLGAQARQESPASEPEEWRRTGEYEHALLGLMAIWDGPSGQPVAFPVAIERAISRAAEERALSSPALRLQLSSNTRLWANYTTVKVERDAAEARAERAEERATQLETLRRLSDGIASHYGQPGYVGDHGVVTIQFNEKTWREFQDTVFQARPPVPESRQTAPQQEDDRG